MRPKPASLSLTLLLAAVVPTLTAQTQPPTGQVDPRTQACGVGKANFETHIDSLRPPTPAIPPGKALVFVFEQMPNLSPLTRKVDIGIDGAWIGVNDAQTYMTFFVDPGVHHLCAHYEGRFAIGEQGPDILHRLNAQPGHTYYVFYRGMAERTDGLISFFTEVDEDQGQLLLFDLQHITAKPRN